MIRRSVSRILPNTSPPNRFFFSSYSSPPLSPPPPHPEPSPSATIVASSLYESRNRIHNPFNPLSNLTSPSSASWIPDLAAADGLIRGRKSEIPMFFIRRDEVDGQMSYGTVTMLRQRQWRRLSTVAEVPQSSSPDKLVDASSSKEEAKSSSQETGPERKNVRGGPVSWLSFLFLVLTGAGLVYYYDREKKHHIEELKAATEAVKQGPSVGQAAIGGPFTLVNHDGASVTEKDFKGKWTLIYFGFTHCPDICPDELQKLVAAIDKIKEKAGFEVVPVFISVDPERDTVEQIREYIKEFHPKLIGLTGSADEVKHVARAYRVYYMKTEEEGSDYLVDHSIVMYLMSPDMEFIKFFGKNNDIDMLTDGVIKEIKQHKKAVKK